MQLKKKAKQQFKRRNRYSFTFTVKSVKSITKNRRKLSILFKKKTQKLNLTLRTEVEPLREERQDVWERKGKKTQSGNDNKNRYNIY